jgi:sialic acid synthase SpsE
MHITIGNKEINNASPSYIIAEAADSHFGDINRAISMINKAKEIGADCIKFQHHIPDEEMLPIVPKSDNFDLSLYEFLKKYALTIEQHKTLKEVCDKIGIKYLCTPFSYKAAQELMTIGIDAFKIGSGEFTDTTMLKDIVKFNKPLILSVGMCDILDIDRTIINVFNGSQVSFALMNCTSEYPPNYEDINLPFIKHLKDCFPDFIIGHSDHTPDNYTSFAAVSMGAKIIEKHITLDHNDKGPDSSVSIDFTEFKDLIEGIRKIEKAMIKKTKIIQEKEKQIAEWAHRSVVTINDIKKGEVLTKENIYTKRPGTGIPSHFYDIILGKKARHSLNKNTLLKLEDYE